MDAISFDKFNQDRLPICACGNQVRFKTFKRSKENWFAKGAKHVRFTCTKCDLLYSATEKEVDAWLEICKTVCTCESSSLFNFGCTCAAKP